MEMSKYVVHPAVRVRNEDFGLLFYNSADTRLTFVKCGTSIQLTPTNDGVTRLKISCGNERDKEKTWTILQHLATKGLIIEAKNGL
jgi:putative mycofactocin binding protein MftB